MTSVAGRVVTPTGVVHGRLTVAGGHIASIDPAPIDPAPIDPAPIDPAPGGGDRPGSGDWIVPGFVDIHVHGGGGHTFTTGDPDAARHAAAFHLRHGTTTMLASLVSSPDELIRSAVAAYRPLVDEGVLAGVHLEGPHLAAARCGAQNPAYLRDPSPGELAELLALAGGTVRMVTLAPELPGALAAIRLLTGAGVVAAVGHTDATYEKTLAAVAAGASVATHLFNGMPPAHHRAPGPVFALLGAPDVIVELVADGVHLHDGTLAFAVAAAGAGRAALVTDAIDAAGMPAGGYALGGQAVTVTDGVARLARDGSLAGSTLTMDAALRRAVGAGIELVDACRMAATTPARAIGLSAVTGALAPGLRADLVVLTPTLHVERVMRGGRWL